MITFKNLLINCVTAVSILALTACSARAQTAPFIRIGKVAHTPIIDGKLDDAAWKKSIEVSGFSVTGTQSPASQQTQVRFVYDNQNLYVSWHVQEPLLVIAMQQMHKVKIDATKLDDNVLNDDSVILFLRPDKDAKMREFDLNSIGTLFDAQSEGDNLWKTRDASWNSGAKAAAVQEDGYWTAELAIPWSAFGLNQPPKTGTSWSLGLARQAAGRDVTSSWNQNKSPYIHSMTQFGTLVFDHHVPTITQAKLASFEAGKSTFTVHSSQQIDVVANLTSGQKTEQVKAAGSGQMSIPLSTQGRKVLFEWNAKAGQKYFYRAPALEVSAISTSAQLTITTQKPWKLYLNGDLWKAGNATQNQDITLPLAQGINDIVMQVQSGQAKLYLKTPLFTPDESVTWRTHDVQPKVLLQKDRSSWKLASQENGVIGKPGKPAYLQHTLLYKSTNYYPVTKPAFYIARDTAQQLTFLAAGVDGIRLNQWQLSLAIPAEFEMLGASGFYANNVGSVPEYNMAKVGVMNIKGEEMQLYHITADKPIVYKEKIHPALVIFEVFVRLPKSARVKQNNQWNIYYWTDANNNAVSEAPHRIAVQALPPINGKQPKKFLWMLYPAYSYVFNNPSVKDDMFDTVRQAGFNVYQTSAIKSNIDILHKYGLEAEIRLRFKSSPIRNVVQPYLKKHPDERLINKDGKPESTFMCTTLVLGKNWPIYKKWIEETINSSGTDIVNYDYELPPFRSAHACFDARCLAAFRAFAKIDKGVNLSAEIVQKKYHDQWIDFMGYRAGLILKKMQAAVHDANSKVLFSVYSGYYDAKNHITKRRYGVDWKIVGEMQAADLAGMGYGRPERRVKESVQVLNGIPLVLGEILNPSDVRSQKPVAPLTKAVLLRRALDATGGVLIFDRDALDGRSWTAVAEMTRLTADYESFFLHKKLVNIKDQDPDYVQLAVGEKHILLCVMNTTDKKSTFKVTVPKNLETGKGYYDNQTVHGGEVLNLELQPGAVRVFVF